MWRPAGATMARSSNLLSKLPAVLLACGGCLVLLGWVCNLPLLSSFLPGLVAMNPCTAVLFIVSAGLLALHSMPAAARSHLRIGIASVVIVAGLLVLLGFWLGWQVGIDRVLFAEKLGITAWPPTLPPISSFSDLAFCS